MGRKSYPNNTIFSKGLSHYEKGMRKFAGVLLAILALIAFFTSIKSTIAELAQSSGGANSLGVIVGLQLVWILLEFFAYRLLRKNKGV